MDIRKLIEELQNRMGMFIEEVRLDYIYYFIEGWLMARLSGHEATDMDEKFKRWFFDWILEWVKKNKDEDYENKDVYWHHIIYDVATDENEAVELFMKLAFEFFADVENVKIKRIWV